jgi:hypothetical protein
VALRACTVVIQDLNETSHSLDVTAETLYEAIAQALSTLQSNGWVGDIGHPEVTHVVKIQDFENWLNGGCKSPAETMMKTRLRQMLGLQKK